MLSTFGLFAATFSCWLFGGIRLNNRFCRGWFHFIKMKTISRPHELRQLTSQDGEHAPKRSLKELLHFTHVFMPPPEAALFEQWSQREQEWVALFQPKWGYLCNMSSDEAGTAACGIPPPELPF